MDPTRSGPWEHEERFAATVAREAGAIVLRWYGEGVHVEWKGRGDPVTEADKEANAHIVERLRREFPGDAVLAEESADDRSRLGKDRLWVVDPLDGTREFVDRNGEFVVMVALAAQRRAVAGAIFHPTSGTLLRAREGGGAWAEDSAGVRRLRVSDRTDLAGFRLLVSRSHRSPKIDAVRDALGLRREEPCGSVGLKMARLARGDADLYVHFGGGTKEWDLGAPDILIHEAGGAVTDISGARIPYNREDVRTPAPFVASNGARHHEILERLAGLG
ncbi:MAG: 3'(2'),5'-bisphosphate nucleotidase CysQ [Deltaproteobacteria bacterium]|nr:3'(2'),5'-bisphosphate nucleotidase CysQ [Deltaproteobacteria bacterium]